MGNAEAKLNVIREPGKTPKFGFCPADDLLVLQQFKSPPGVLRHNGNHIGSVGVKPLVKGIDNWLPFPDHVDRGSQGAWKRLVTTKLESWGLGVSNRVGQE